MTDLVERLEQATAGSRELDAEVAQVLGWTVHNARRSGLWAVTDGRDYDDLNPLDDNSGILIELGHHTTSIDAAVALAERVFPCWAWSVGQNLHHKYWHAYALTLGEDHASVQAVSATAKAPALALCAAIIRAHAEQVQG